MTSIPIISSYLSCYCPYLTNRDNIRRIRFKTEFSSIPFNTILHRCSPDKLKEFWLIVWGKYYLSFINAF